MNLEESQNLWQSTLENVKLPEEKQMGETRCYLSILSRWDLLHQIYNHKKATVARYRMISTIRSTFVNLNYSSVDLQNPIGPTLGFTSLEESISAAVTITNRIANINQQYSIPLLVTLIYLYAKDEEISEEFKIVLIRSVRSVGLDIPIIGKLEYVKDVRVKELSTSLGIFYLNIDGSVALAHVQPERLSPKSRFRPKDQIVYDGMHYVLLSTKTEHSKVNMLSLGALAVHNYTENVEISPWESEDNLRTYLSNVQVGTHVVMLVTDLYSCETSKGIVYNSKFLYSLYSAYKQICMSNKNILVESFTFPYLSLEGEHTIYTFENQDLVYFLYGGLGGIGIIADVTPSDSINSNIQTMTGKEMKIVSHAETSVPFESEIMSTILKLESQINSMSVVLNKILDNSTISSEANQCTIPQEYTFTTYAPTSLGESAEIKEENVVETREENVVETKDETKEENVEDNINSVNFLDIMKLMIPQPVNIRKSTHSIDADIEAANIFDKILEANVSGSNSRNIGLAMYLPTTFDKSFIPANLPEDTNDEPEITAVTSEMSIQPIFELNTPNLQNVD